VAESDRPLKRNLRINDWPDNAAWQRRHTETEAAYMAFLTFVTLPLPNRTVARALEETGTADVPGEQKKWKRWCALNNWVVRATAYERWAREQELMEQEERQSGETARWARVRTEQRDKQLAVGQALIAKAEAMLQFPLAEVTRVTEVYEDGRAKTVQTFTPAKWRFGDVARMVDVGAKLVRLAAEMETEYHRVDMRVIREEAEQLAAQFKLDANDLLAVADKIVEERWQGGNPFGGSFSLGDDDES
jgi:hypothetical protein